MILREVQIGANRGENYPFNFDFIDSTTSIEFKTPITVICGDNACGKSTLLKSIAHHHGAITVDNLGYVFKNVISLSEKLNLIYSNKNPHGFYFSSEDFISFIKYLEATEEEIRKHKKELEEEFEGKSEYSKGLALYPLMKSLYQMEHFYNGKLNTKSHGEGYLAFFEARLRKKGLYFLDEPESPLSMVNQLKLAQTILSKAREGYQFIIVTHSPILMSLPGATLLQLTDRLEEIDYHENDNYLLMENFMRDPRRFWHYYMGDSEA